MNTLLPLSLPERVSADESEGGCVCLLQKYKRIERREFIQISTAEQTMKDLNNKYSLCAVTSIFVKLKCLCHLGITLIITIQITLDIKVSRSRVVT